MALVDSGYILNMQRIRPLIPFLTAFTSKTKHMQYYHQLLQSGKFVNIAVLRLMYWAPASSGTYTMSSAILF